MVDILTYTYTRGHNKKPYKEILKKLRNLMSFIQLREIIR